MPEIVWGTGVADDGDKPGKASSFTTPVIAKGMSRKQTLGPTIYGRNMIGEGCGLAYEGCV